MTRRSPIVTVHNFRPLRFLNNLTLCAIGLKFTVYMFDVNLIAFTIIIPASRLSGGFWHFMAIDTIELNSLLSI